MTQLLSFGNASSCETKAVAMVGFNALKEGNICYYNVVRMALPHILSFAICVKLHPSSTVRLLTCYSFISLSLFPLGLIVVGTMPRE
jgi:hypothetical protein